MTQYPIEHEFPNHDQGRKEAIKALLDGVCLKNAYGTIAAFINNHFRYWNTLDPGWCLLWDSSLIDRGPWTVVEDPSKPKPKKWAEMTAEEQQARFYEVCAAQEVIIKVPEQANPRNESSYNHFTRQYGGWVHSTLSYFMLALQMDWPIELDPKEEG